ncbi:MULTISPECIES: hypothetical protein [unclassified Sulfitobacter]|jgi:hypothetical protein|uniref:hypothetical protein n=1 Tax=unclassified Sulfitobacter TaxID=196795 RepID=UPI001594828A|nr:hypothetical protein [Sulfitobacter sp. HGT1]MBQ0804106.1 hypothetical protein [Sulfitobacter sp.]
MKTATVLQGFMNWTRVSHHSIVIEYGGSLPNPEKMLKIRWDWFLLPFLSLREFCRGQAFFYADAGFRHWKQCADLLGDLGRNLGNIADFLGRADAKCASIWKQWPKIPATLIF